MVGSIQDEINTCGGLVVPESMYTPKHEIDKLFNSPEHLVTTATLREFELIQKYYGDLSDDRRLIVPLTVPGSSGT